MPASPGDPPRSNYERMITGELYVADDPEMERRFRRALRLADAYHRATVADDPGARALLAELLGSLGEGSVIRPPLFVDYGDNLHVGARTFVNYNLTALDVAAITIGDDCQIGPNVQLLTPTHPVEPEPRRAKLEGARPITIGDNVWLGGGVIVCPGVSVGDDAVVGAGAVVTRDVPAGFVAVGNPARAVRRVQADSGVSPAG